MAVQLRTLKRKKLRICKYRQEEGERSVKITFREEYNSQVVLGEAKKFTRREKLIGIFIRRDKSKVEREKKSK